MLEEQIETYGGRTLVNRRQKHADADSGSLDPVNRRLLAELQADARLSLAELGRRVGLTAPAVGERLQRLEESGVVRGYHAEVDPRALGYALSAVLRIRPASRQIPTVADLARRTAEVVECHRITGEDCFLMKLHVRDVEHLERVIDIFAQFGQTTTSIVQSSPVPGRGIALDAGDRPDPLEAGGPSRSGLTARSGRDAGAAPPAGR
jgi:Lrp/AsnC family leucine-responsive transcriptional regulator